jgi:predicted kinase
MDIIHKLLGSKSKSKSRSKSRSKSESKSSSISRSKSRTITRPNTRSNTKLDNQNSVKRNKSVNTAKLNTATPDSPNFADINLEKKPWLNSEFIEHIYDRLKSERITRVDEPKLLILIGPPASGKSTVKKQLHFSNCINIDLDEISIIVKETFDKAFIINDYAIFIQILIKKAISDSYNVILDSTGRMVSPIKYVVRKSKAANYKIIFAFVWSSLNTVRERVKFRNTSQLLRQAMPGPVVIKVYEEFITKGIMSYYLINKPELVNAADEVYLFNNDVNTNDLKDTTAKIQSNAQIVYKSVNKTVEVSNDFEGYYDINVLSREPHFEKNSSSVGRGKKRPNKTKGISILNNTT